MEFIELGNFSKTVLGLLNDDEYVGLQIDLTENPALGDLIKGGGGIRKVRYAIKNKGKSGGVRVIYYWRSQNDEIYFLEIYPKTAKENLSDDEVNKLARLAKGLKDGK